MMYTIIENNVVVDRIDSDGATVAAMFDDKIVIEGKYPRGYLLKDKTLVPPENIKILDEYFVATSGFNGFTGPVLALANKALTYQDDNTDIPVQVNDDNKFFPDTDRTVVLEGDIVDSLNNVVTTINAPRINLVVEMQADDKPNGREVYFVGDIVNGHLTVTGKFPENTNYKIIVQTIFSIQC